MINLADRCRVCGRGLSDLESRKRGVGPDCWANLTPQQQTHYLVLAAQAADPARIPPVRRPSAQALANNAAARAATRAVSRGRVCERHGGLIGACPQCRREANPDKAAARIIAEIRAEREQARRAWEVSHG